MGVLRVIKEVSKVIKESFDGVLLRGFQKNFKEVTGCSKSNPMAFQLSFKACQSSSKEVSRVLQEKLLGYFRKVSRVFQECFKGD